MFFQGTLTDKDVLIKELQAKNTELISAIDEGKKEADSIQQDLDKVNAEQSKLESECSKLQKINAVSLFSINYQFTCTYV